MVAKLTVLCLIEEVGRGELSTVTRRWREVEEGVVVEEGFGLDVRLPGRLFDGARKLQAWGIGRGWPEEGESLGEAIHGENGDGGGASRRSRWKRNERGRKGLGCVQGGRGSVYACVVSSRRGPSGLERRGRGIVGAGQRNGRPMARRPRAGGEATATAIWGGEPAE